MITPGSIIITFTPNGPSSYLSDSERPSIANFELTYAVDAGNPILPATELMFTIFPEPCSLIIGATFCIILTTEKKFVSNCSLNSSSETSSPVPHMPHPALFTSTSILPFS